MSEHYKIYLVPHDIDARINSDSYAGLKGNEGGWQSLITAMRNCAQFRPASDVKEAHLQGIAASIQNLEALHAATEDE